MLIVIVFMRNITLSTNKDKTLFDAENLSYENFVNKVFCQLNTFPVK